MRIAVVANTTWYLYNFRLNLMHTLQDKGHEVVAIGPADGYVASLEAAGIRHVSIPLSGGSTNPLREVRSVWHIHKAMRQERIDAVLSFTPKGNIYTAMAAGLLGIPTIPNVSGLGRAFVARGALTNVVMLLYRLTFGRAPHVFFQNLEDMAHFVHSGVVRAEVAERIPGSGVDLTRFSPEERRGSPMAGRFVFLLVGRMIWDKGVGDFVDAARRVRARFPQAEFWLLGMLDVENPAAISREQMARWVSEGIVKYLGSSDNVLPLLRDADCVVLPSYYREGVPRSLLEAASVGKPIITTDAIGCRDVVEDGVNGFLCRPRDAEDLAEKMLCVVSLSADARARMGQMGREKMRKEFDERLVISRYVNVVESLAG